MDLDHDLDPDAPNPHPLEVAEGIEALILDAEEAERDLLTVYVPTNTLAADNAALRSVVRRLMEGEVPALARDGHSYWYGLDETSVPTYKGRRLTDEETRILLEIV